MEAKEAAAGESRTTPMLGQRKPPLDLLGRVEKLQLHLRRCSAARCKSEEEATKLRKTWENRPFSSLPLFSHIPRWLHLQDFEVLEAAVHREGLRVVAGA